MFHNIKNGRANSTSRGVVQAVDRIALLHLSDQGIFEKAAPLYASGMSLREIALELPVSKTKIREVLLERGLILAPKNGGTSHTAAPTRRRHIGVAPYGYVVLSGKLVADPREQQIIQRVLTQWRSGKSLNAIAKALNSQKVHPRNAKAWDHSMIRSIVQRNKTN